MNAADGLEDVDDPEIALAKPIHRRRRLRVRMGNRDPWGLAAAVLLGLATLATAWAGYQAAKWSGEVNRETRLAIVARFDATQAADDADRELMIDTMAFTAWLEAYTGGNQRYAAAVVERFRPEFASAFDSWFTATPPEDLTEGAPLDDPAYVEALSAQADSKLAVAETHELAAARADDISDAYVMVAVLYASVLFLAGIASKLPDEYSRLAVVVSGITLVVAVILTFANPIELGYL